MPNWARVDANFWTSPKVWAAGFWGAMIFEQLLLVNRAHNCDGHLPPSLCNPRYLVRLIGMDRAEGIDGDAIEVVKRALHDAEQADLIELSEVGCRIVGWDRTWSEGGSAARMRIWRDRKTLASSRSDVTERHVTDVTATRARAGASDSGSGPDPDPDLELELSAHKNVSEHPAGPIAAAGAALTPSAFAAMDQALQADPTAWAQQALADITGQQTTGIPKTSPTVQTVKPERKRRAKPEPPPEALAAAVLLVDYIASNTPTSKLALASESDRARQAEAWADSIRLLHDQDRIGYEAITAMVHWCQRHEFWRGVILSGAKLRAKWDQLAVQRDRDASRRSARAPAPRQQPVTGRAEPRPHDDYQDGEVPI